MMKVLAKLMTVLFLASTLFAQQHPGSTTDQPAKKDSAETRELVPDNFYKLAFAVYELQDGKRTNQRDYMMIGKTNNSNGSSLRISTRVPILTEEKGEDKKITYIDVGLNLRCPVKDQAGKLQVECDIEISNFLHPEQYANVSGGAPTPVIRATRTSSWALLTLGKPMIMATLDDINSAKRLQIEVTATKLD